MFSKYVPSSKNTQKRIFLGSPEAEAEAAEISRVPLQDVYEDYHGISEALSAEKFIVLGRKGSGKSAFGTFLQTKSLSEPNLHCKFIRKSDVNLEKIIQQGQEAGASVDAESFFKWIIYTSILSLFAKMQPLENKKEYDDLKKFLNKNRGYIEVSELETKQLILKHGLDISVDYFKRFFNAKFNRQIEIKAERASYYKLLPHLEELIINLLTSRDCIENGNSFAVFFDDLDIDFHLSNQTSTASLMSLIRACRQINNDVFGKNNISAKAILFIRDDIERHIVHAGGHADSAKMFTSYATRIDWYQEEYSGLPAQENDIALKKFINKRIEYVFKKIGLRLGGTDPWESLVASDSRYKTTSFKYVVNQTLFRPRDLLLFFIPLEKERRGIPLDYTTIKDLADKYSSELAKEIKNELSAKYSTLEIEAIFKILGKMFFGQSSGQIPQEQALSIVRSTLPLMDPYEIISDLFESSLIGTANKQGWYHFKCRESEAKKGLLKIESDDDLVVQYGIRTYLQINNYR